MLEQHYITSMPKKQRRRKKSLQEIDTMDATDKKYECDATGECIYGKSKTAKAGINQQPMVAKKHPKNL